MTIAAWTATAEPYAEDSINYGTPTKVTRTADGTELSYMSVDLVNALNWWGDDDEIQKLWLQKTTVSTSRLACVQVKNLSDGTEDVAAYEFGGMSYVSSSTLYSWNAYSAMRINNGSQSTRVYFEGIGTGGTNEWDLWIRWYPYWAERNPLQIVYSCFAWQMMKADQKAWLDQTTFQALDTYYDDMEFKLFVLPRTRTVAEIAKDAWRHTTDWLAIRPAASGGAVTLHAIGRKQATEITDIIDLDDPGTFVSEWEVTVRRDLQVRHVKLTYGEGFKWRSSLRTDDDYYEYPLQDPKSLQTFESRCDQHAYQDYIFVDDLPAVQRRRDLAIHYDPSMWRDEQYEITLVMGPFHWNYEVGDLVRVKCDELELVGTGDYEWFVVTHKSPDFKRHTARLTLLRVWGTRGIHPHTIGQDNGTPEPLYGFSSSTLGDRPDGTTLEDAQPRNWDRWENEFRRSSSDYALPYHAREETTSNSLVVKDDTSRNRWPYIDLGHFDLGRSSTSKALEYATAMDFTGGYYYLVYIGWLSQSAVDHVILSFGDTTDKIKFGRLSTHTAGHYGYYTNTDGWKTADVSPSALDIHVLTIGLGHGGGTDGRIGIDGTWVSTGLTYTTTSLDAPAYLGNDVETDRNDFKGHGLFFWGTGTNSQLPNITDGIEDHLMEKFRLEMGL